MTARYKLEKPVLKNEEEPEWEDFEDEELIDAFEEEKQMTPKEIYRYVSSQILGQEEAVKAALADYYTKRGEPVPPECSVEADGR